MILGVNYYLMLILAIVAALVGYRMLNNGVCLTGNSSFIIYNVMIWYVVITLPGALTGFWYMVKRIRTIEDEERRHVMYSWLGLARILIIGIGLIATIVFFYLTTDLTAGKRNMSLFWLAAIEAIGLVYCKPTEKRIAKDLEEEEE